MIWQLWHAGLLAQHCWPHLTTSAVASRIKYQLCWLKAPIKCSYKIFPNRWRNNGHILRNGWLITYNWWVLPITWGGNCLISSREGSRHSRYLDTLSHHSTLTRLVVIIYRVSQKKVWSQKTWPQLLWNPSEREEVGVFWKIQLKCCRIGPKHFKIGVKMA